MCKIDKYIDGNLTGTHNYAKCLVVSSLSFLIPAICAFYRKQYLDSVSICIISCISANFWRKPTYSWRRDVDIVVARVSLVVYVVKGLIYVRYVPYMVTGLPGLVGILYCYYLSDVLLYAKNANWYKFHMAFHYIITYEFLIILDSIHNITKPII